MKSSNRNKAIFALIITNIIWGAAFPIYKWSLENLDPYNFAFLRFFIAALIILPFTKYNLKIHKDDYFKITFASLAGVTMTVLLWLTGLKYTASINAPIIGATEPIFILFLATFILREKLKKRIVIGTLISMVGVLLIVFKPTVSDNASNALFGNILFLLATFCGITYSLIIKRLTKKYHLLTLTFWSFLIGALGLMPFALYSTYMHGFFPNLNFQGIVGIVYATIFSSVVAYTLFTYGIRNLQANESGIFIYIDPIIALIVAMPLLGETITMTYAFGSLLVLTGIYIADGNIHPHITHKVKHI